MDIGCFFHGDGRCAHQIARRIFTGRYGRTPLAAEAMMQVNRAMWMGHFELTAEDQVPCFRYTCLFHDRHSDSVYTNIQDIVDVCFAQCERYQSVFQILASQCPTDPQVLSLAMMDTAGES